MPTRDGLVKTRPIRHGSGILGQRLKSPEGRTFPVNGTEDDGDHTGLARIVQLHCPPYLNIVTVV